MNSQKNILKSVLFVLIQFISLGAIALTGPLIAENRILFALEMIGIGLGVWAVIVMRPGYFNITPDPLSNSKLVTAGPYRFIRHPMYLALLLTTFPLILDEFSIIRLVFWLILLIDLVLKMRYEERLLAAGVDQYDRYLKKSRRLIPFVY